MPRNGSGNYSLPEAAFVPGTTISSAAVNSDFSDIATALTGSVAADGQTPLTAPIKFTDGTTTAPGITFNTNTNDGIYHPLAGNIGISLAGSGAFIFKSVSATNGSGLIGSGGAVLIPIGIVLDFGGSTAPSGWFFPYGQAVSRLTYSELFTVYGTTFGSGDGSTTFNLPDLRGRLVAGLDNMGGSAAGRLTITTMTPNGQTVGATGGAQTVTLDTTMIPAHSHPVVDPGHVHTIPIGSRSIGSVSNVSPFSDTLSGTLSTNSATTGITTSNAGGGLAHGNVQPTMVMNKIIFAGHP